MLASDWSLPTHPLEHPRYTVHTHARPHVARWYVCAIKLVRFLPAARFSSEFPVAKLPVRACTRERIASVQRPRLRPSSRPFLLLPAEKPFREAGQLRPPFLRGIFVRARGSRTCVICASQPPSCVRLHPGNQSNTPRPAIPLYGAANPRDVLSPKDKPSPEAPPRWVALSCEKEIPISPTSFIIRSADSADLAGFLSATKQTRVLS